MDKTIKINKLQGLLLVVAGIVLLSAMCFAVVFANFAITDKVANAEVLPIEPESPSRLTYGFNVGDVGRWIYFSGNFVSSDVYFDWINIAVFEDSQGRELILKLYNSSSSCLARLDSDYYNSGESFVYDRNLYIRGANSFYCPTSNLTCSWLIADDGTSISQYALYFISHFVGFYQSLPNIYANIGYNLLVSDYNALVDNYNQLDEEYNQLDEEYSQLEDDYNQLEDEYNSLVESTQYVTVANNSGSIYTGEFGTYGSDLLYTGNFNESIVATFVGRNNTSSYEQVLGFVNLGDTFLAGSNFKFTYHVLTSFASSEPVHLGVIHDGSIYDVFVTSSVNEINENYYTVEFVLPYDTSTFVLYSGANVFAISAFTLQVRTNATQALIDSAYQRGVDSVNVNAIAKQAEEAGYYRGLSEQNPYTFRSLMGAVVDAPLDVFTQMFDFDILGVNMKGLYLSLFTLALVILVIKFALARG